MNSKNMSSNQKNKNSKNKVVRQHYFQAVRDPVVTDASNGANPSMFSLVTDSSGNSNASFILSPFGVAGLSTNNATAGSQTVFTSTTTTSPALPWLYNQARNFERYRVTRAVVIAVGSVGSTASGRLLLDSSTDAADTVSAINVATSTGGKVFDVAALSSRELRFNLDVDSSWKKCSSRTYLLNGSGTVAIPVNHVNDLSFCTLFVGCFGATAAGSTAVGTSICQFFLEYDVEFRDPISYGANI